MSSQILCCALGGSVNIQIPTKLGRKGLKGIVTEKSYRDYDGMNGEPTEFEWNIFPGFTTLQLCGKEVNDPLSDRGEAPEFFTGRFLFMSIFNDISCDRKDNPRSMLGKCRSRQSICREDLVLDNGHVLDQVLKRSGFLEKRKVYKEFGIAEEMFLEFA